MRRSAVKLRRSWRCLAAWKADLSVTCAGWHRIRNRCSNHGWGNPASLSLELSARARQDGGRNPMSKNTKWKETGTRTPQVKLSLLWQLLGNPNKQNRLTHPHTRHNLLEVITQLSKWNMKLEVIAWKLISFDWVKINLGTNCCLVHSCHK